MLNESTYEFPSFNGAGMAVWEWVCKFIPHLTGHVITYTCGDHVGINQINLLVIGVPGYRAPSQYPKRRLFVRSREVSKPRDLYLELSDRSEIWQALRQHCCRCACQISKRYDNLKYHSRGFETLRDLTKRRLFGYWDGAQAVTTVTRKQIKHHLFVTESYAVHIELQ